MFENEQWDAQLAADYSGEYVEVTDAVGGLSQVGDPITWVTASVAYHVTEKFTVAIEGRNLADEFYMSTMGRPDMLAGFETWGRSLLLGVTAKF
jgi:outer membrane receptor protein involved in Fe transport